MSEIKHVWFDFAGTLYKETPEFQKVHDQLRYKTYAKLVGITNLENAKQEFEILYQKHGSNSAVFRSLGQTSDYWMKVADNMDSTSLLHPDPEISKTLIALRKILPTSLFTNLRMNKLLDLLKHLEIPKENFTHIINGDDVAERKPALDGFRLMIKKSGLPPDQILYVGDRIDVDVKPAKVVGMLSGLLYVQSKEADFCFGSFRDILSLLEEKI